MALLTQRSSSWRRCKGAALGRSTAAKSAMRRQPGRFGYTMLMLGVMVSAVCWNTQAVPADVAVAREYQVKAVFLFNFVQFVTWPAAAFPDPQWPITIGILGNDPFGPFLEAAVQGEVIDGRSLTVKRFQQIEEVSGSHMLFVSKSESGRLGQILAAVQGKSILTVGETAAFARQGGIINFITVDSKVRYEINVEAAKRANLDISSKLLRLAKIVGSSMNN
jgi:hypothetical protein